MTRKRGLLAAAVLAAVGIGIYVGLTAGGGETVDGFDAARWQSARGADPDKNPRAGLLKSLNSAVRLGMSRTQVQDLLGPADREQPEKLIYALGIAFPSVDYQYYVFEFGPDGGLTRHYLTRN